MPEQVTHKDISDLKDIMKDDRHEFSEMIQSKWLLPMTDKLDTIIGIVYKNDEKMNSIEKHFEEMKSNMKNKVENKELKDYKKWVWRSLVVISLIGLFLSAFLYEKIDKVEDTLHGYKFEVIN